MEHQVYNRLNQLGIDFQVVEHPAALTTAEADYYIQGMEVCRTKSLFLTDRKKTAYYLVIMDDKKQLDLNAFRELVGGKRLHMASLDSLKEKMQVPAGTVSVFGLLNNPEKDIQVYFDKEILSESILTFHPNINTKTVFIKTEDVLKFLDSIDFTAHVVEL